MQSNAKNIEYFRGEAFKDFLANHVHKANEDLVLRYSDPSRPAMKQFAAQWDLYQKAIHKLPEYVDKLCIFDSRAYEQASSELTAGYKSGLFTGDQMLDLCGGLGVDDWAFSQSFQKVSSLDPDEDLNRLAMFNFQNLGRHNIERHSQRAEDYLSQSIQQFDLIYADADRRPGGKREFSLSGSEPDIPSLLPLMLQHSRNILIKASPMADITACLRQLMYIKKVEVLSVMNEVKELLFFLEKEYQGPVNYVATDLTKSGGFQSFHPEHPEEDIDYMRVLNSGSYLYEPAAALIKSGLVKSYAASLTEKPKMASPNAYLLMSEQKIEGFFGRSFYIRHVLPYKTSEIMSWLKAHKISQANVSKRNFPDPVELIRKKLKLKDGGEDYLFFTRVGKELCCIHCSRISRP